MENAKSENTKQLNLAIDERLFGELKKSGLVETKYDLSRLCGKNNSYYTCMRHRKYGLHVGSLTFLAAWLAKRINETEELRERTCFRMALHAVHEAVAEKCRLRELELDEQRAVARSGER